MTYRRRVLAAAAAATLVLQAGAGVAAAQDFTWAGAIPQGRAIEIKGINGDVRAEPSGSNQVEVVAVKSARRDDPASVQIQVVPHGGGVTICSVYPHREGSRPNECAPGEAGRSNVQIGQRPFEMGHRAPAVLIDLIQGKKVADPLYTGLDECTPKNLGKCPAQ